MRSHLLPVCCLFGIASPEYRVPEPSGLVSRSLAPGGGGGLLALEMGSTVPPALSKPDPVVICLIECIDRPV